MQGVLRYSEKYRFYVQTKDGRKFVCSDYEQTICTKNELLCSVLFNINEMDEAINIDILN